MAYAIDDVARIQDRLLLELETGRSLRQVCGDDGMPHFATVMRWVAADAAFASRYTRARTTQADTLFERMEAVEESVSAGTIDSHAARVILDSMRWRASKLAPKVYGDRLDVSVTETKISITAALQAAQGRMSDAITIVDALPEPRSAPKPLHIPNMQDATDAHTKERAFVHEVQSHALPVHIPDATEVQEVQTKAKDKAPWPRPKPTPEPKPATKPKPSGASAKLAALQARLDAISSG